MQTSVVALVRNTSYQPEALRQSIERALALIEQPLSRLIRSGDRVLVKPYLRHGPMRTPETNMISQPAIIEAVIALVRDCGGHPMLGDEGSRRLRQTQPPPDEMWLHLLAERAGAELVSFAKAGGRLVPSGIPRPHQYLLSRAVLDADVVINLANAVLHPTLVWSGAVKNMFNTVIGAGNAQLFELLRERDELNAAVADLCRLSRPTVSLSDMTTVCPDSKADLWRVGLIGASTDPVALDSVSVRALGWDPAEIGHLTWGQRLGFGHWEQPHIDLRGLSWSDLPVLAQPPPARPGPSLPRAGCRRRCASSTRRRCARARSSTPGTATAAPTASGSAPSAPSAPAPGAGRSSTTRAAWIAWCAPKPARRARSPRAPAAGRRSPCGPAPSPAGPGGAARPATCGASASSPCACS